MMLNAVGLNQQQEYNYLMLTKKCFADRVSFLTAN